MIKLFIDSSQIHGSSIMISDPGDMKHLVKVLRVRKGDEVIISDKGEWEYTTEVETIGEKTVSLKITDRQKESREPYTRVTLYQGIPKGQKMETVIQKTVELGIDTIVPVFMKRTVVAESGSISKKLIRWQKIADEAVKQCKRNVIPEIEEPVDFPGMLEDIKKKGFDLVICPYEDEDKKTIKDCLTDAKRAAEKDHKRIRTAAVIIGPEGGFEEREIAELKDSDSHIVSLGRIILRTETAGPAALSMIMYEMEL